MIDYLTVVVTPPEAARMAEQKESPQLTPVAAALLSGAQFWYEQSWMPCLKSGLVQAHAKSVAPQPSSGALAIMLLAHVF